jgi:cold shock CspA family protein
VIGQNPEEGYGNVETPHGRVIFFHRNSVLKNAFDKLEIGSEMRFAEEAGEQDPQTSNAALVGKQHVAD